MAGLDKKYPPEFLEMLDEIARWAADERLKLGEKSKEKFAAKSDVGRTNYAKIEEGEANFTIWSFYQIIKGLKKDWRDVINLKQKTADL